MKVKKSKQAMKPRYPIHRQFADCRMLVCMATIGKDDRSMSWQVAQRAVDFCLEHTMNLARLLGRPPEAHLVSSAANPAFLTKFYA